MNFRIILKRELIFSLVILLLSVSCNKKVRLTVNDLAVLTNAKVEKIVAQKRYKVLSQGLQDVFFVNQTDANKLLVVDKAMTSPKVILEKKFTKEWHGLAVKFINPGLAYSHIFLVLKNSTTNKFKLVLLSYTGFEQSFDLTEKDLKALFIYKNPKRAGEEYIEINGLSYRFDSFNYIETILEMPLFFLDKIVFGNEEGWIILRNKGGFSGRSYISLSFPNLSSSSMSNSIGLTKKINTVKLYHPGKQLYSIDKIYRAARYPTIEITKQPFNSGSKMRLPLKILPSAGKMLLRISYNYRGTMMNWPTKLALKKSHSHIVKDQQGFPAYIIDLAKLK